MARGTIRLDHQPVNFGSAEVKDPRLMMINPNNCVEVCRHWSLARDYSALPSFDEGLRRPENNRFDRRQSLRDPPRRTTLLRRLIEINACSGRRRKKPNEDRPRNGFALASTKCR